MMTIKDLKEMIDNQSDEMEVHLYQMAHTHTNIPLQVGKNGTTMEIEF